MSRRTLPIVGAGIAAFKIVVAGAAMAVDVLTLRLAVQLGRQQKSRAMTVDEIAADALELVRCGQLVRRSLSKGLRPGVHIRAATVIAERYGADLVVTRETDGGTLAIKFWSGLYSSQHRNLFFLA